MTFANISARTGRAAAPRRLGTFPRFASSLPARAPHPAAPASNPCRTTARRDEASPPLASRTSASQPARHASSATSRARDARNGVPVPLVASATLGARSSASASASPSHRRQPPTLLLLLAAAAASSGLALSLLLLPREPLSAQSADPDPPKPSSSQPRFAKDQVSLLCLIGHPHSGRSTQAKRMAEFFEGWEVVSGIKDVPHLLRVVEERRAAKKLKPDERISLIVDGFPTTLPQDRQLEAELVPVFCYLFFDLPLKDYLERTKSSDASRWQTADDAVMPLVKKARFDGNILEMAAHWDTADEVWEMVEAKVEQVLELRERGDL